MSGIRKLQFARLALFAACALLSALALGRFLYFITLGENVPSNDSLLNAILVGKILDGHYDWKNFFQDVFQSGHLNFFPILLLALFAILTGWNFRASLFFGVAIAIVTIVLLHSAFTQSGKGRLSALLWPMLFWLAFSTASLDVFQLDLSSFQLGLNHLGLALGMWGLLRFSDKWQAIALMILGGWLATWSWGSGAVTWPTFLLGMRLLRFKKKSHYLLFLGGGLLCLVPYLYLLLYPPAGQEPKLLADWSPKFIISALGYFFSQGFSPETAFRRGAAGILAGIAGVLLAWTLRHQIPLKRATAPLMLIFYVLLHFGQVSLFRNLWRPWYNYQAALYWMGLAGLAYVFLSQKTWPAQWVRWLGKLWGAGVVSLMLIYYLSSNLTYLDKITTLKYQGPAAVSCLLDYQEAPTYCERHLFRWEPFQELAEMAHALDRHGLSIFSPRRTQSLQGDVGLSRVSFHDSEEKSRWLIEGSDQEAPYHDFRRLNLYLPRGNEAEWLVPIPRNVKSAALKFSARLHSRDSAKFSPSEIPLRIFVEKDAPQRGPPALYRPLRLDQDWKNFKIDLSHFAGEQLRILLSSAQEGGPGILYRHPSIEFEQAQATPQFSAYHPSNTDLHWKFPVNIQRQLPLLGSVEWTIGSPALQVSNLAEAISLADFTHLYFRMAVPRSIYPRSARMLLKVEDGKIQEREVIIPLLTDELSHAYSYDLRLLELSHQARLLNVRIFPIQISNLVGTKIIVEALGLI